MILIDANLLIYAVNEDAPSHVTSDAHLAALAIEHGAELCTADNDFARFKRLRRRNPLA